MNESMIEKWNEVVTKKDIVYYLGDFGLAPKEQLTKIVERLNFKKLVLVKGNHDKSDSAMLEIGFTEVHKYMDLKIQGRSIFLSHVPMVSKYHDVVLCGHVHDKFKLNGSIYNVGVDVNEFRPVSIDEIFVKYWKSLKPEFFVPMELDIKGEG
jgi:calcineurin-like phosphoesterase family protein